VETGEPTKPLAMSVRAAGAPRPVIVLSALTSRSARRGRSAAARLNRQFDQRTVDGRGRTSVNRESADDRRSMILHDRTSPERSRNALSGLRIRSERAEWMSRVQADETSRQPATERLGILAAASGWRSCTGLGRSFSSHRVQDGAVALYG
jgi:hypothetical protein